MSYHRIIAAQLSNLCDTPNLNVMYMFLQHSCYSLHTHTHSINLNAPPVLLRMQDATSSPVGPGARYSTASTSEEHSVMDPVEMWHVLQFFCIWVRFLGFSNIKFHIYSSKLTCSKTSRPCLKIPEGLICLWHLAFHIKEHTYMLNILKNRVLLRPKREPVIGPLSWTKLIQSTKSHSTSIMCSLIFS
jgi:hypothetical protein